MHTLLVGLGAPSYAHPEFMEVLIFIGLGALLLASYLCLYRNACFISSGHAVSTETP